MSTPLPPASIPFDARPLTEPVDAAAVHAHAQQMRASLGAHPAQTVVTAVVIVLIAITALFTIVPAIIGGIVLLVNTAGSGNMAGAVVGALLPVTTVVMLGALAFLIVRRFSRLGKVRRYRLHRFAEANGMHYVPRELNPPLPGMVFQLGRDRNANDVLRGTEPRFVEFGNYRYTTGSGKNSTTHRWGYVAIHLDVPLPHIVLDALGNNGLFGASNLPMVYQRDQRLDLEGDFNQHFALYCPSGYEQDALYLFTPDIMARFVDHAAALDVEIVDDWLFLYAKRDFSTLDVATWAWLFGAVAALLTKLEQWARWRDERLERGRTGALSGLPFAAPTSILTPPPPGVAHEGKRLRSRVSWAILVPIAAAAIWVFARFFFELF